MKKHKNYLVLIYKILKKNKANTSINLAMLDMIVKDFIDRPEVAGIGFKKLYIDLLRVVRLSKENEKVQNIESFFDTWYLQE